MSTVRSGSEKAAGLVRLDDLIDALEAQSDTVFSYLDRSTGEVHAISDEAFRMAEDEAADDTITKRQQEEVELARTIAASDRYVNLPSSWDVHEWAIMKQFCYSLADDGLRAEFLMAIQGRGSFRHFKSELTHHALWESWKQFRRGALRELVIAWCQEQSIAFVS
jgi:Uncharacterised protein family (UPF0158)